jgi:hypothetical protein
LYIEPFDSGAVIPCGAREVSGGTWRDITGSDAAVQPQHERRKYLHDGTLWKFSGLAHYGRTKLQRARDLHEAGFAADAIGFERGFLLTRWRQGTEATSLDEDLLDTMAQYLAFLSERYDTGRAPEFDKLTEMIRVNTGRNCTEPTHAATTVAVDGRMLPHEWINTNTGWIKTDGLDHHDDHFFPGCQDIAWDVAGAGVEFGFDPCLLSVRVARLTGDRTLTARLPFYRTAYLAWRIGYSTLAAETLGETTDGRRFRVLTQRYRRLLDA